MTGSCWYSPRLDSASHLLARSRTMTSTLSHSQIRPLRRRSGMLADLAGAFDVGYAAAADFRVFGVGADVRQEVPATHTLAMAGFDDAELEAGYVGIHGALPCFGQRREAGGGGDQYEAQFVAQFVQGGAELVIGVQGDFGLQVTAQYLGVAQVFQFLVD